MSLRSIAAAASLVTASVLLIGAPAQADSIGTMPSGCGITAATPTIGSQNRVTFGGSAHCGGASSIDFRLVHNYDNNVPDARVKEVNIQLNDASYSGLTCDNGGTTQYYSEIAFRGLSSTVQRVSKTVTLTHC